MPFVKGISGNPGGRSRDQIYGRENVLSALMNQFNDLQSADLASIEGVSYSDFSKGDISAILADISATDSERVQEDATNVT